MVCPANGGLTPPAGAPWLLTGVGVLGMNIGGGDALSPAPWTLTGVEDGDGVDDGDGVSTGDGVATGDGIATGDGVATGDGAGTASGAGAATVNFCGRMMAPGTTGRAGPGWDLGTFSGSENPPLSSRSW